MAAKSLFDLTGKVAVVTGATKGIGLGIAQQLVLHGARVVVSSRHQDQCEQLADALNTEYGRGEIIAKGFACDLNRFDDIEPFAEKARSAFDGVDILVGNAAYLSFVGPSATTPPDVFDQTLIANIHHNFRLCQALRADIAQRGGGSIVLIGSVMGLMPALTNMAYGISKAGVTHMVRCLGDEFAADRIRVNCVAPGLIRSFTSLQKVGEEGLARSAAKIPLQRVGRPEDIAGAVVFLVSDAGSYVSGVTIPVDGGRTFLSTPGALNALKEAWEGGREVNAGLVRPHAG